MTAPGAAGPNQEPGSPMADRTWSTRTTASMQDAGEPRAIDEGLHGGLAQGVECRVRRGEHRPVAALEVVRISRKGRPSSPTSGARDVARWPTNVSNRPSAASTSAMLPVPLRMSSMVRLARGPGQAPSRTGEDTDREPTNLTVSVQCDPGSDFT